MARKKIQVVVPQEGTPREEQLGEGPKTERNRSAAESPIELVWKTCGETQGAQRQDRIEASLRPAGIATGEGEVITLADQIPCWAYSTSAHVVQGQIRP